MSDPTLEERRKRALALLSLRGGVNITLDPMLTSWQVRALADLLVEAGVITEDRYDERVQVVQVEHLEAMARGEGIVPTTPGVNGELRH